MKQLRVFAAFWYDFIIGDDWRIAVGVVLGLGATALLVHAAEINAWWLPISIVLIGLTASVWLAARSARSRS